MQRYTTGKKTPSYPFNITHVFNVQLILAYRIYQFPGLLRGNCTGILDFNYFNSQVLCQVQIKFLTDFHLNNVLSFVFYRYHSKYNNNVKLFRLYSLFDHRIRKIFLRLKISKGFRSNKNLFIRSVINYVTISLFKYMYNVLQRCPIPSSHTNFYIVRSSITSSTKTLQCSQQTLVIW